MSKTWTEIMTRVKVRKVRRFWKIVEKRNGRTVTSAGTFKSKSKAQERARALNMGVVEPVAATIGYVGRLGELK